MKVSLMILFAHYNVIIKINFFYFKAHFNGLIFL
jgi:hypothetical protein